MAARRTAAGWAAGLVLAFAAAAVGEDSEPLRLGVPSVLEKHARALVRRVAQQTSRPVRVAVGSEYQLLDWMDKGLLDEAVVSPLTAFLLLHDEATEATPERPARLPKRSDFECRDTQDADPDAALRTRMRAYRSNASGTWAPAADPAVRFEDALDRIWDLAAASSGGAGREPDFLFVLPSHLSVSGFAAPVSWAARHYEGKAAAAAEGESPSADRFWRLFFERTHFHLGVPPREWDARYPHRLGYSAGDESRPAARTIIEFAPDVLPSGPKGGGWHAFELDPQSGPVAAEHKRYVEHLRVARVEGGPPPGGAHDHVGLPFDHALESLFLAPGVGDALHGTFVPARRGQARPFAFKLPEVLRLLGMEQARSGRELALVLPGGGVKSAYQSVLIDHLYGADYLENRVAHTAGAPLRVDYVLGNSGGALTGAFVACLDRDDGRLLETMWKPDGENALTSTDIFGFWGLARWLSVLMCCAVFMVVARVFQPTRKDVKKDAGSRLRYSLSWTAFLAATPLVFKMANGPHGAEHVPAAAGFVYFLCVCLGLVGDNVWLVRSSSRRKATWKHVLSWALLVVAVLCAVTPGAIRWLCERELIEVAPQTHRFLARIVAFNMPAAAIVCCVGVVLTLVAFMLRMSLDREHLRSTGVWRFARELTVLLSVPVVTYLVMLVPQSAGMLSWLELTGPFWLWLMGIAAAYSLALVSFARDTRIEWLKKAVSDLCSRHQGRTFRIRRLSRIVLFGFLAWGWWSLTVAPAMYGNVHSNRYLRERVAAFFPDLKTDHAVPLKTVFIAPANALASNEERYFVFFPRTAGVELSDEARFLLERDHRWVQLPDPRVDLLSKVVFASGSPYPIFPAHELAYPWHEADEPAPDPTVGADEIDVDATFGTCELPAPAGMRKEWLVDGGFAHDIPLEAAKIAGARQILIVDSIPESEATGAVTYSPHQHVFSELVGNLPRVFPFLFRQSQAVDAMTRRDLFVATLVPSGDTADWPLLFDFRTPIVDRLIAEAEGDIRRRLGRVQNWGQPAFR